MSDKICEHKEWMVEPSWERPTVFYCRHCRLRTSAGEYALFLALREQVAILRELVALQKAKS